MGRRQRAVTLMTAASTALVLLVASAGPAGADGEPAYVRSWQVTAPAGIATDADGNVFVSQPELDRVVKYDPQGNQIGLRTGLTDPTALAVNGSDLYVLDSGAVVRFDAAGTSLGSWPTGLDAPTDMAVSGSFAYVLSNADAGPSKQIRQFISGNGILIRSWSDRIETRAVAVRQDVTRVYTINRHTEVGNTLTEILSRDGAGGTIGYFNTQAPVGSPVGLANDAANNVYATDTSHVTRFAPDGSPTAQWGGAGSAPGQFSSPADVTVSGDRVFVADTGNNRVQVFTFAPVTTCRGQAVTVYLDAGDVPTVGDDVILGTAEGDTIDALEGDDVVCSLGGDDTVLGGAGKDNLDGGTGADTLSGGDAEDHLFGGIGPDELQGGDGPDVSTGGPGRDRLFGGPRNDGLFGGIGDDALAGNQGDDLCAGGDGTDRAGPSCEFTRGLP